MIKITQISFVIVMGSIGKGSSMNLVCNRASYSRKVDDRAFECC